jgi:hypothetical protein
VVGRIAYEGEPMIQFTVPTELPCTVDTFWACFTDSAAVVKTFQSIGFTKYDLLEVRDEPTRYFRKVEARPPIDAPAVVQKIIGPSFGYVEEAGLDKATRVWTWKVTPSVLADRSKIGGTIHCESVGASRCRVDFNATIDIKMIGLSGILEATGEKSTRASWTTFMTAFAKVIPL